MRIIKADHDISAFEKRLWKEFWEENKRTQDYRKMKFLIKEEDADIGYIHLIISGGTMKVEDIIVDKKSRGNKIGHRIMEFIYDLAKAQMCHKIRLETSKEFMPVAFELYRKHGFMIEGNLKDDMHGKDWVVMSRQLVRKIE